MLAPSAPSWSRREQAKAKAEADAHAKAEAETRAKAAAVERERREAEAKAARDAALKAAREAASAEKAQREAEAKAAQAALEKAERETAAANAAQQAAKAAQLAAEKKALELQEVLEKAKQQAAANAEKRATQNQVAALVPGEAPQAVLNSTDLIHLMKFHLRQAGCDPGDDTGIWTKGARRALGQFNEHAGTHLNPDLPSMDSLKSLQSKEGRVCPLVCGKGTRMEGDHCVAIKSKSDEKRNTKSAPSGARSASGGGSAARFALSVPEQGSRRV